MNKNTIQLIIIVIVIICFGLGGLGLVIFNIKNDEKHMFAPDDKPSEMMLETESPNTPDGGDEPADTLPPSTSSGMGGEAPYEE